MENMLNFHDPLLNYPLPNTSPLFSGDYEMLTIPNRWALTRPRPSNLGASLTVAVCFLVLFACMIGVYISSPRTGLHLRGHNVFDMTIESHLNRFVNRWPRFDLLVSLFAEHNLLKGAPIVFLCWAAFFEKPRVGQSDMENRAKFAAVIPLAIASVILARVLAVILPFQERPFRTAVLHFQLPHSSSMESVYGWSSFPSDHAVLFTALAVAVFFASRRLGALAFSYVFLLIIGPRLYLGVHWPTDVLAGAALGTAIAAIATISAYRNFVWRWVVRGWNFYPGLFAASMFLLSYEITDLFDTPIAIVRMLLRHKHG
jgi:undecaprenyl-diphosphatase